MFKKGLTLIEVIVASLILAIAISAFLYTFSKRSEFIRLSKNRTYAVEIISQKFEILQHLKTKHDIETFFQTRFQEGIPGITDKDNPEIINVAGIDFKLFYKYPQERIKLGSDSDPFIKDDGFGAPAVYQVEATVQWTHSGKDNSITMFTRTLE